MPTYDNGMQFMHQRTTQPRGEICGIIDRPWARFFCSKFQKQKDRESRKEQRAKSKERKQEAKSPAAKSPKPKSGFRWSVGLPCPLPPITPGIPAASSSQQLLPSALGPQAQAQAPSPRSPSRPKPPAAQAHQANEQPKAGQGSPKPLNTGCCAYGVSQCG
jgi:hypothetical protein